MIDIQHFLWEDLSRFYFVNLTIPPHICCVIKSQTFILQLSYQILLQNMKGENISKDDGTVQAEYVIEDSLQATTVEIDNGKSHFFLFLIDK